MKRSMNSSQKIIFAPFVLFHLSVCLSTQLALSLYNVVKTKAVQLAPFLKALQYQPFWDELKSAETIQEWELASLKLDIINDPPSPYYDDNLIAARLDHIRHMAVDSRDVPALMQVIRASLVRNLAGIDNPHLYSKFYIGTKALIEEYIEQVAQQLFRIADLDALEQGSVELMPGRSSIADHQCIDSPAALTPSLVPALSPQAKYAYFAESLRSFGRSALLLAGGMSLGLYHLGVARALYQKNVLPSILCGSSIGGALVAAILCSLSRAELSGFFKDPPSHISYEPFEKIGSRGSLKRKLFRFLKHGHLVNIQVLQEFVRSNIGNITFAEAYEKSHRILNISVASSRRSETPALLNYLTAPDVVVWSAACASGTGLGLYDPVSLLFKTPSGELQPWSPREMDWAVAKDESELPLTRLSELFNVNNFIVSKVVPYRLPIVDYLIPTTPVPSSASLITKFCGCMISEIRHRLYQLSHLGIFPSFCADLVRSLASAQGEVSDSVIYISPNIELADAMNILANPSPELTRQWMLKGERATWPQLSRLQIRLRLEIVLESILERLKKSSPELAPIYEMLTNNSLFKEDWSSRFYADHFGLGTAISRRKRTKSMY